MSTLRALENADASQCSRSARMGAESRRVFDRARGVCDAHLAHRLRRLRAAAKLRAGALAVSDWTAPPVSMLDGAERASSELDEFINFYHNEVRSYKKRLVMQMLPQAQPTSSIKHISAPAAHAIVLYQVNRRM